MKKYLAAGAVGVVAFAFAASAAQLNVDGGVLQAGQDDTLYCTSNADIVYETGYSATGKFDVRAFNAVFPDDSCDGLLAHIKVNEFAPGTVNYNPNNYMIAEIDGDSVRFPTDPAATADGYPLVKDVESVSILVKSPAQGGEVDGYGSGIFGKRY